MRWLSAAGVVLLAGLSGCGGAPICPEGSVSYTDADGDGYGDEDFPVYTCTALRPELIPLGGDCDDGNIKINPGVEEKCDGKDNNCDGQIDEDLPGPTWYPDRDTDGWGVAEGSKTQCAEPEGYTDRLGDCDDDNPDNFPFNNEICDGIDNDCDNRVDTLDEDLWGAPRWYPDNDGDGYGDPYWVIGGLRSCEAIPGFLERSGDCDDSDPAIHPDAIETCSGPGQEPVDEDCDFQIDEADPDFDPSVGGGPSWTDSDGDGLGDPLTEVIGCDLPYGNVVNADDCDDTDPLVLDSLDWYEDADGDGVGAGAPVAGCDPPYAGWVTAAGPDCDDTDPSSFPGGVETCGDGVDQDCSGADEACLWPLGGALGRSDADAMLDGSVAGGRVGTVVSAGDLDGNGAMDLLVGAPGIGNGTAYVLSGPLVGGETLAGASATVEGAAVGELGAVGDLSGDLSGDGTQDLVVGSPVGPAAAGSLHVFFGPVVGTVAEDAADASVQLDPYALLLALDAGGDADNDTQGDLLVGADGEVGLFLGPLSGPSAWSAAASVFPPGTGTVGAHLAWAGDTDGDGTDEVLIGSSDEATGLGGADAGVVRLYEGPFAAVMATTDATLTVEGAVGGAALGPVEGGADLDGDGQPDLLIGAPQDASGAGTLAVVPGSTRGLWSSISAPLATVQGLNAGDGVGTTMAAADVDGDGFSEVMVGARGMDGYGGDFGAAYLIYGPIAGAVDLSLAGAVITGDAVGGGAEPLAVALADLSGDGWVDGVIGRPDDDTSAIDAGAVGVFFSVPVP